MPPPSSGDNSDTEPGLATTQDPDSEVSDGADLERPDSEDDSGPRSACEKALVSDLITSVRDTLKIEGSVEATEAPVPFGFRKATRTAKVFPCVSYLDKLL